METTVEAVILSVDTMFEIVFTELQATYHGLHVNSKVY